MERPQLPYSRRELVEALKTGSTLCTDLAARMSPPHEELSLSDYLEAVAAHRAYAFNTNRLFNEAMDEAAMRRRDEERSRAVQKEIWLSLGLTPPWEREAKDDAEGSETVDDETQGALVPLAALGPLLDELEDRVVNAIEKRLKVIVMPGLQFGFEAHLETNIIPNLEDRVLRRLESRLSRFKYSHPVYDTIIKTLKRRLPGTFAEEVADEVAWKWKDRILAELGDIVGQRVKEQLSFSTSAILDPPHHPPTKSSTASPVTSPRGSKRPSVEDSESDDEHPGKRGWKLF